MLGQATAQQPTIADRYHATWPKTLSDHDFVGAALAADCGAMSEGIG